MRKKRKKKSKDQTDRQCIIYGREEAKGDENRFLPNTFR